MPQCRRIGLAVIIATIMAITIPIAAQRDRIKIEYPVRTFAVTETESEVGFEYQYFGETIERGGGDRIRYSNNYFQEYYEGRARGYIYHPRFVSYTSRLRLGLAQQSLSRKGIDRNESTSSNDELLGYDLRLDLFHEHPVSGSVFTRRDERILMGLFIDRFLTRTESTGGTVRWRNAYVPMDLSLTHTETEEFGTQSYSKTRSDVLEYNAHNNIRDRIRTDLQYRLQRYDRHFRAETFSGDVERDSEIQSQDLTLNNRIDFDASRRNYLRSLFRVHRQENNEDLTTYYWQEHLQSQLSENLRGYLTGSWSRNDYSTRTVDTYRGEAGLDHDLFKSLRSHIDIHARRTEYDPQREDRIGATGRLNYRKATPAGVLSAGYARTIDRVERTGQSSTQEIRDESHTLRTSDAEFLDESNVIEGSIVVTDTNNEVTYSEGFDYEVVRRGNRIGLRVLPGGLLADGDSVLVDYSVITEGDLRYLADDQDIYIRHDFTRYIPGLSLYARQHDAWARDVSGPASDARFNEYTDRTFGLRQEWRDFAFTSEYQDYDADSGGYNQWRNQLEGNHALNSRVRVGWNAGINDTEYDRDEDARNEDRHSQYLFAGTHIDGTIARNGFWKIEARSMRETGRTERTINGILARVGLNWRRMTFEAGARFEQYDVSDTDRDRVQVFVGFKRSLGRRPRSGASR